MSEPIVTAVEHVSIAVRDADGAKQTFAALGFEPQWVEDVPGQGLRSHVLRAAGVVLELIEPAAAAPAAGSLERFLARRGEGLHHLCLRVNSLEEATRAVEAAGMRLVDQVPTVDEQGRRVFVHPDSAHGVLIGLVEPHPGRLVEPHPGKAAPPGQPGGRLVLGASDPAFEGRTYVAAVARAGIPLFISGLTAASPDGTVEGGTVAAQAREIFARLARILAEAGAGPANVVKTTDYIVSREGYRAVAGVRREFFGEHFPAATGIVVKELLGRGVLIEMDAVAML
jgi:methylmalonyl-CoA/ethylmalonyl-CoA epimerase